MNNSSNSKSNTLFIVICIILIFFFLILFLYVKGINQDLKLKYEKNTFFLELDKYPYNPFNAYKETSICVKGENQNRFISNDYLKIRQNNPEFLLMFWFKIKSKDVIDDKKQTEPSYFNTPLINHEPSSKGDTEKNLMLKLDDRYKIKLNTRNASIEFLMNGKSSILSNIPYDKWICLATFYTNDYTEIYLNGRLAETLQYTNPDFDSSLNNSKLEIGHFPGHLAYLVVSVKDTYFNSYSIYQEYLYYKNKITRSDKHKNNIDFNFKLNLGLLDNNYNKDDLYRNDRSNICNN